MKLLRTKRATSTVEQMIVFSCILPLPGDVYLSIECSICLTLPPFCSAVEYCVRHLVQTTFKNDSLIEFGQGFPATLLGNYVYLFIFIFLFFTKLNFDWTFTICYCGIVQDVIGSVCFVSYNRHHYTTGLSEILLQVLDHLSSRPETRINRTFWFFRFSGSKLN